MEDRSYSSLSRHSLASSNSLLDGVPFKIGQNFRQPPKVVAPPELSKSNVSAVLEIEYTFETEEAVLAWAQAREDALKQAAEEQAKRLKEEKQKQAAEAANNTAIKNLNGETIESDADDFSDSNQSGENVYDIPKSTLQNHISQDKPPLLPKPPVVARKPVSEPSTILKPTPVHSSASSVVKRVETSTDNKLTDASSTFDVSMFESEADPFDNLELQTINDMEELKILLDSSAKPTAVETSQKLAGDGASETMYDIAIVVKENKWETFCDDIPDQNTRTETACETLDQRGETPIMTDSSSADDASEKITEDGDYVEITDSYKKQTVKFQNHAFNGVSKTLNSDSSENIPNTVLGGKFSVNLVNSKLYKPVLPPFTKSLSTTNDNSIPNINPFIQTAKGTNPFLPLTTENTKNPFLQNTPDHWVSFSQTSDSDDEISSNLPKEQSDFSLKASSVPVPSSKPSLLPPPPSSGRLTKNRQFVPNSRMWSSVGPSLAASLDDSVSISNRVPYNPYSRHSLSSSDIHSSVSCSDLDVMNRKSPELQRPTASQSSLQAWNRNRPLPPIPSPTPECYKVNLLPPNQQVGLTDPYHSLSPEAQAFTNSLTSMGFLRARVARAVAKFGQDEKEVLDHLIAVDMLVDKKYAPVLVESALITYKNDVEKAEKFLQMFTQFEELGFKSSKIQDALVTTNMDYDKVLDILTT